jgi:adenylate kinase
MRLLLLGPQGSGKSTQAKLLAEKYNLCFISIGELVRAKALEDSSEGRRVKEIMERGDLVDDVTVANLFKEKLENGCENGFVTDSYPRRISQVETYDPEIEKVIYLEIPDSEVLKRLLSRGRIDDTKEAIGKRLGIYHSETKPLLDYYRDMGRLAEVDGVGDIEEVFKRLEEKI